MNPGLKGDLWRLRKARDWIALPLAIGWKADGVAVLERGLVSDASRRFPELLSWWGGVCRGGAAKTPVSAHARLKVVAFPTRPLTPRPSTSWKAEPNFPLIERSARELLEIVPLLPGGGRILLPVAEVAGSLDPERVGALLRGILATQPRICLVYTDGYDDTRTRSGLPVWLQDPTPDEPLPEEAEASLMIPEPPTPPSLETLAGLEVLLDADGAEVGEDEEAEVGVEFDADTEPEGFDPIQALLDMGADYEGEDGLEFDRLIGED